jgi:5-(carboxyamino)imidazole ribonucleotide mutase
MTHPKVGIVMGSASDWDSMKYAAEWLTEFHIPFEKKVLSAHRTPDVLTEYAKTAAERGLKVIIAGAGGAAHAAGMAAAHTLLPVLGVPMASFGLQGMDALLSTVQMPAGVAVGTLAIGVAGAKNAALLAAQILALSDASVAKTLVEFRRKQTEKVLSQKLPD